MKRFRYGLEGVLAWQKTRERELQREAHELAYVLRQELDALRQVQSRMGEIQQHLEQSEELRPGWTMSLLSGLAAASGQVRVLDARVDEARMAYERNRLELTEAMRERKKLERHRERREDEHRVRAAAFESSEADELTTVRFVHERLHAQARGAQLAREDAQ